MSTVESEGPEEESQELVASASTMETSEPVSDIVKIVLIAIRWWITDRKMPTMLMMSRDVRDEGALSSRRMMVSGRG